MLWSISCILLTSTSLSLIVIVYTVILWTFQVTVVVKNLPANAEIEIWSLGQEDLLEEGMATHSSFFVWKIPWTEEPSGL